MRSIIVFLVIFVLSSVNAYAGDHTFRKTRWGMSPDQVKSIEALEVAKEDDGFLGYKTQVIGKDVFLAYFFVNKKLVRARYVLAEAHSNKNDFISDYDDFKNILTKKYGKPQKDESFWKNDLYKDEVSSWGMAISVGHLVYFSSWDTTDTEISNILIGENYSISCIVEYISKELKVIETQANENKALESF